MLLRRSIAGPEDAARIVAIHMAAFGPNIMLQAQFPTEETRRGLQHSIEMKARADIEDANTTVLVTWAFDKQKADPVDHVPEGTKGSTTDLRSDGGEIIGFAKWAHPVDASEDYQEPAWIWPEGTAYDVLNSWTEVTEQAQNAAIGSELCYRLTFIATDPLYTKQGAGSLMVAWGLERCEEQGVAAYLESTMEAVPFYEKVGFTSAVSLSLDVDVRDNNNKTTQKYQEVGMVYRPHLKREKITYV